MDAQVFERMKAEIRENALLIADGKDPFLALDAYTEKVLGRAVPKYKPSQVAGRYRKPEGVVRKSNPIKWTPELERRLMSMLADGLSYAEAGKEIGVSRTAANQKKRQIVKRKTA